MPIQNLYFEECKKTVAEADHLCGKYIIAQVEITGGINKHLRNKDTGSFNKRYPLISGREYNSVRHTSGLRCGFRDLRRWSVQYMMNRQYLKLGRGRLTNTDYKLILSWRCRAPPAVDFESRPTLQQSSFTYCRHLQSYN